MKKFKQLFFAGAFAFILSSQPVLSINAAPTPTATIVDDETEEENQTVTATPTPAAEDADTEAGTDHRP